MATTYNFTNGSITGVPIPTQCTLDENQPFILRAIIDLTKQNLSHSTSDVGQLLIIPAGTTVLTAWIRVITAGTTSATCTLGTGLSAAVWGTGLALDSAAATILGHLFDPQYFATADTVDIVVGGATDILGKYEVCALCLKTLNAY
jgi:hypothetical protein